MKKYIPKAIVTVAGIILFSALDTNVAIPSFLIKNIDLGIQYGLLAFVSTQFGPVVGLLVGFVGHALSVHHSNTWLPWAISSGLFGLLVGLGCKSLDIKKNKFDLKFFLRFNGVQLASSLISFALLAPVLAILFYEHDAGYVFEQGLVAALSNSFTTLVVGSLLCVSYSMIIAQDREYEKLNSSKH